MNKQINSSYLKTVKPVLTSCIIFRPQHWFMFQICREKNRLESIMSSDFYYCRLSFPNLKLQNPKCSKNLTLIEHNTTNGKSHTMKCFHVHNYYINTLTAFKHVYQVYIKNKWISVRLGPTPKASYIHISTLVSETFLVPSMLAKGYSIYIIFDCGKIHRLYNALTQLF